MMFKAVFLVLFAVSIAKADTFKQGLKELSKANIEKATHIFCQIGKNSIMYNYADYYCTLLTSIKKDPKIPPNYSPKLAIDHYKLFFLSKYYMDKNLKLAYSIFKKIDKKALHKEDLPEYTYLHYKLSNKKEEPLKTLITDFVYDELYGFPLLKKHIDHLPENQLYKAVNKLIFHRKFDNALYVLDRLKDTDRKFFYKSSIFLKKRKYKKAEEQFRQIHKDSRYYLLGLYKLTTGLRNFEKQKQYFSKLSKLQNTKYTEKASYILMKKSFFKGRWKEFKFFSKKIDKNSKYYSEKIWLDILYRYKTEDYIGAYLLLEENKKMFPSSKVYYWLYLISKKAKLKNSTKFLKKATNSKALNFYSLYSREILKLNNKNQKFTPKVEDVNLDTDTLLIKKLKNLKLYRWAYIEGKYLLKKKRGKEELKQLYKALPELTAKKFALIGAVYESFPKPFSIPTYSSFKDFEELTFAVMRQESFFDYYALSISNAMGLMQIIPPTAKWIAKIRNKELTNLKLLFNPEINIDFGSWYLAYLLKIFNNNLFYTVASYNAGPNAVKRFLKKNPITDIAEFVEFFPYEETRNYTKKVIRNYLVYKYLLK
ncbi:MAG: lytic transglycosylase domain-containing protein [Aquificae bacterium]|nr:lytic transglycosylase domain-containing protein [Aquificota bacterium]